MMDRSLFVCCLFMLMCSYVVAQQCEQSVNAARFDCFPESGASQDKCVARGCCWHEPIKEKHRLRNGSTIVDGDVNIPYCYFPKDFPTYRVSMREPTDFGERIQLVKSQASYIPADFLNLTVDLIFESKERFRLRIYNSLDQQYQVPLPVPTVEKKAETTDYQVTVNENPFSLLVTRQSTGAIL